MDPRLGAPVLALLALTACAVDRDDVELVYRLTMDWCSGCAGFELKFQSRGHVWFTGLAGCAIPGTHHYLIPPEDFNALVDALPRARFFSTPRRGQIVIHAGGIDLEYRDDRRVHEVEDGGRFDPRLRALQRQFRATARPEPYLEPSTQLYAERLKARWDVNSKNRDGWTALTCAVVRNRVDAVQLLLDHDADVSRLDLAYAVGSDGGIRDVAILRSLLAKMPIDPAGDIAAMMRSIAKAESNAEALSFLRDYGIRAAP